MLDYHGREVAIALWRDNHFDEVSDEEIVSFAKAFHFSVTNHTDILRKSGESYYRHDCRTAARALAAGLPITLAVVMLLHEAIEDNGWSHAMIEADFGQEIADIVDALSKRPKENFANRAKRLDDHMKRLRQAIPLNFLVAVGKLLDRRDNINDTAGLGEEEEKRLFEETESHFLPLFHWAKQFVPEKFSNVYSLWIMEIEFACDNYWRARALGRKN